MQLFSYLSARDSYTAKMIRYLSECNCEVPVTPDPVWGFNQNVSNIPSKDDVVKITRPSLKQSLEQREPNKAVAWLEAQSGKVVTKKLINEFINYMNYDKD